MDYRRVLEFWFGAQADRLVEPRDFWFRKSDAIDDEIRRDFGPTIEAALAGDLGDWALTTAGTRALILVLDQFTRNAFRGTARSFVGDAAALALARRLVATGADRSCRPVERWFIYMPFEHSESLIDQYESVRLFRSLAADGLDAPLEWAQKHCDFIRRFGRFPHRNEILGRSSTAAEIAFLQQPGSRFQPACLGLDVTEPEPIPPDSPLLELENALIVPHIASASITSRDQMSWMAAQNLIAGLKGERLPNCVNPQVYSQK